MADLDKLTDSILKYLEGIKESRKEAASETARGTRAETYGLHRDMADLGDISGADKEKAAKIMGYDKDMAREAKSFYLAQLKVESQISRIMKEEGITMDKAIAKLKKQKAELKTIDGINKEQLQKEEDRLRIMEKTYEIEKKKARLERISKFVGGGPGGPGGPPGKGPLSVIGKLGENIPGVGGIVSTVANVMKLVIDAIIRTITFLPKMVTKVITTFMDLMHKAWDGGLQGLNQGTIDFFSGLAKKIPLFGGMLGDLIGTFGTMAVKMYMMSLGDWIAKQKVDILAKARTGAGGGADLFSGMMKATGGIRKRAEEWSSAFIETGTRANTAMATQMYRIGQTMQLSSSQTRQYFEQMLISAGDASKAMRNMSTMFGMADKMAKITGISTTQFSKAIADASVQARMMNVDMRSVANVTNMLAKKQKDLAGWGISLRDSLSKLVTGMSTLGKKWDYSMHAFMGIRMYGEKYRKETGKEMSVGRGIVASRFGYKTATGMGFTKEGVLKGLEGTKTTDVYATKMESMMSYVRDATKGMSEGEAFITQNKMLKELFGVDDEQLRITMMQTDNFKSLAKDSRVQKKLMTTKQIQERTLSIQERGEQIQRLIMRIMMSVFTIIGVIWKFIKPTLLWVAGGIVKLAGTMMRVFSPSKWFSSEKNVMEKWSDYIDKAKKGADMDLKSFKQNIDVGNTLKQSALSIKKGMEDLTKKVGVGDYILKQGKKGFKTRTGWGVDTKHGGGTIKGGVPAIIEDGELLNNEMYVYSKRNVDVTSKEGARGGLGEKTEVTKAGNITNIYLQIPDSDPDTIANKLRTHLVRQHA